MGKTTGFIWKSDDADDALNSCVKFNGIMQYTIPFLENHWLVMQLRVSKEEKLIKSP